MSEEIKIRKQENITGICTGDVVINLNENNKSILEIGNLKIYNTKKFNWFNRLMFKIVFGINIKKMK